MRIAYITNYNSANIHNWSGLAYYIRKALEKQGADILPINCSFHLSTLFKLKTKIYKLFGKTHQTQLDLLYLRIIARKAEKLLKDKDFDIIFCPGSLPLAYLQSNKPIVFWTDATFKSMVNFYPYWTNLTQHCLKIGEKAEQQAISKASLIIYTSDWAIKSAVNSYRASPNKVKCIQFGANIEGMNDTAEVEELINSRYSKATSRYSKATIELLFIGVNWDGKGGINALETTIKLRQQGFDTKLTVVGCKIPDKIKDLDFIEHYNFISKKNREGLALLRSLYKKATFFILPTKFDCTPVVFAEACSFGLPIITSNVGGCSSLVLEGYNGSCISLENFSESAANKIISLLSSEETYREYGLNAFSFYKNELNWEVAGKKAIEAMERLVQNTNPSPSNITNVH